MNLLRKRPLAFVLLTFLFGSVFSFFIPGRVQLILAGAALLLAITLFFLKPTRRFSANALAFLLAILVSYTGFSMRTKVIEPYAGKPVVVIGTIQEIVRETDTYTTVQIISEEIEGQPVNFLYPILIEANIPAHDADVGKRTAILTTFEITSTDLSVENSYSLADGVVASCTEAFPLEIPEESHAFLTFTSSFRQELHARILSAVEGENGELISELIFGNGSLSGTTRLFYRRAGASHMLAISGMHLSILTYFLLFVMVHLRFPKKLRSIILVLFLLFYVLLTGLQASVIRSAVMTFISLLGSISGKPYDGFTALSLTATGMLLFQPYIICDAGFLLSVMATYGIVIAVEWESKRKRQKKLPTGKIYGYILSSILLSSAAIIATLPVTTILFGEISLVAIPVNLLLSPLVSLLIVLSLLLVLLPISPIAFLASLVADMTTNGVSFFSSYPHAVLPVSALAVRLSLSVLFFLLAVFLCFPIKRKKLILLPASLSVGVLLFSLVATPFMKSGKISIFYGTDASGDVVITETVGGAVLTDGGMNEKKLSRFLYSTKENGINSLSAMIVLSYDEQTAARIRTVGSIMNIESIYLPTPINDEERSAASSLYTIANEIFSSVYMYHSESALLLGGMKVSIHTATVENFGAVACISYTLGEAEALYLSSNFHFYGDVEAASAAIGRADAIILGLHRGDAAEIIPYRNPSKTLEYIVVGDSALVAWQGANALEVMEKAEVIDTPAFYKLKLKT